MDKKSQSVFHTCVSRRLSELGKTQQWLADKLGVSAGSVSEVLTGNPSFKKIAEYAKALNCEPWQLIRPDTAESPQNPTQARVLKKLEALEDHQWASIEALVDGLTAQNRAQAPKAAAVKKPKDDQAP